MEEQADDSVSDAAITSDTLISTDVSTPGDAAATGEASGYDAWTDNAEADEDETGVSDATQTLNTAAAPGVKNPDILRKPSDRHKLVADISIFHYKRLKTVAADRGIPVDQLLEELIDRMWTYRSTQ